ncbi:MAG: VanW family protein [Candidatus Omnitrophica bacterium]|nr:VanW family protein [Candidatus Omnitrophota bacterium]
MNKIIVIAAFCCFIFPCVSEEPATPCLLGSSSTPLLASTAERIQNILLAVEQIDGIILKPGESFSFNETVGERTLAAGFLSAPAIVHAKLQDVVGGGICQVSSTLFNAVLLSDLKIVERHRHHTPINYLPLGMDATISWGTKDFRFKNTSPGRIKIVGRVTDKTVNFEIYGETALQDELRLETEIIESPSLLPEEESEPGLEIALYRVRLKKGKIIAREFIHRDFYPARTIQK